MNCRASSGLASMLPNMQCAVVLLLLLSSLSVAAAMFGKTNFSESVDIHHGGSRGKILDNGSLLVLSLDEKSGSSFQSKTMYVYIRADVQIKLPRGNNAGIVTSFSISSRWTEEAYKEISFDILGNISGLPYTLQTNFVVNGKGSREVQFKPWFDPTQDFHNYTIMWSTTGILFAVDGVSLRTINYTKPESDSGKLRIRGSIEKATGWATKGDRGSCTIDWSKAPFTATFRGLNFDDCYFIDQGYEMGYDYRCSAGWDGKYQGPLLQKFQWVQKKYVIYDYCSDAQRFAHRLPPGCAQQ